MISSCFVSLLIANVVTLVLRLLKQLLVLVTYLHAATTHTQGYGITSVGVGIAMMVSFFFPPGIMNNPR